MIRRETTTRQARMTAAVHAGKDCAGPSGPSWRAVLRVAGAGLADRFRGDPPGPLPDRLPDDPGDRLAVPAAGDRRLRPRAGRAGHRPARHRQPAGGRGGSALRAGYPGRLPAIGLDRAVRVHRGPHDRRHHRRRDRRGRVRGPAGPALAPVEADGAAATPAGFPARIFPAITRTAATTAAALAVAALALLGVAVAGAGSPAPAATGMGEERHDRRGDRTDQRPGLHPVLFRPGYPGHVEMLRQLRRVLAPGDRRRRSRPGVCRAGGRRYDPDRRLPSAHLQRASVVHLHRRQRSRPGPGQQPQPQRRPVARGARLPVRRIRPQARTRPDVHGNDYAEPTRHRWSPTATTTGRRRQMRHGSLGRAVCRIMLITADPAAEAGGHRHHDPDPRSAGPRLCQLDAQGTDRRAAGGGHRDHAAAERKPEGELLTEEYAQYTASCAASTCPEARSRVAHKAVGVAGGWRWVPAAAGAGWRLGICAGLLAGVAGCRLAWWGLSGAVDEPGAAG